MNPQKNWFKRLFVGDRRRADRLPKPGLIVYFWTGAAPGATRIRDISSTGLYLLTEERWYPGTVVRITLQRPDVAGDGRERSISVQSEVIRFGTDGVGLAFILPEFEESRGEKSHTDIVTAKKTLIGFLQRFTANKS